jgi:hypothetical protein
VDIREKCSCGAEFKAIGDEAEKLHRSWVKRHTCPDVIEQRDVEMSSTIGFSADYLGTGLDIPAKEYDPWDE